MDRGPRTSPNEGNPDPGGFDPGLYRNFPDPNSPSNDPATNYRNLKPDADAGLNEAAAVEQNVRKPGMPDIEVEEGSEPAAPEVNDKDFLPADTTAFNRSSHFEILKMQRLAGRSTIRRVSTSKVSSSQKKQLPPRWISIPMPAGRVRL